VSLLTKQKQKKVAFIVILNT